jgi:hypothetical protein
MTVTPVAKFPSALRISDRSIAKQTSLYCNDHKSRQACSTERRGPRGLLPSP